jgi:hypothetical protein
MLSEFQTHNLLPHCCQTSAKRRKGLKTFSDIVVPSSIRLSRYLRLVNLYAMTTEGGSVTKTPTMAIIASLDSNMRVTRNLELGFEKNEIVFRLVRDST